jgi:predicted MFS family arabinose efflux permease
MASIKVTTPIVASVALAAVIPAVVYFGLNSSANDNKNAAKGDQQSITMTTNDRGAPISCVPEANTGLVMIPFVGAVLLFSSLQLLRMKAQKNGSLS